MFSDNLFCNQDQKMIDAGRVQGQGEPVSQTMPTQQKSPEEVESRQFGTRKGLPLGTSQQAGLKYAGEGQTDPLQTAVLIDRGGRR